MDPRSTRHAPNPDPETGGDTTAIPLPERFQADLDLLEQRLEASVAVGTGLADFEPCVWHCACFLVHGA